MVRQKGFINLFFFSFLKSCFEILTRGVMCLAAPLSCLLSPWDQAGKGRQAGRLHFLGSCTGTFVPRSQTQTAMGGLHVNSSCSSPATKGTAIPPDPRRRLVTGIHKHGSSRRCVPYHSEPHHPAILAWTINLNELSIISMLLLLAVHPHW